MKILVILGGISEVIDSVCFIINYFIGCLGKIIIEILFAVGYEVCLIMIKWVVKLVVYFNLSIWEINNIKDFFFEMKECI